jgi:hypothetical protein
VEPKRKIHIPIKTARFVADFLSSTFPRQTSLKYTQNKFAYKLSIVWYLILKISWKVSNNMSWDVYFSRYVSSSNGVTHFSGVLLVTTISRAISIRILETHSVQQGSGMIEWSWNGHKTNTATYRLKVTCISERENFGHLFFFNKKWGYAKLVREFTFALHIRASKEKEVQVCKNIT